MVGGGRNRWPLAVGQSEPKAPRAMGVSGQSVHDVSWAPVYRFVSETLRAMIMSKSCLLSSSCWQVGDSIHREQ